MVASRSAAAAPRRRLSPLASSDVFSGVSSMRTAHSAIASSLGGLAVTRHSRRRYLRRRVRGPCAGIAIPPYSWRRHARPPLLRGGGSRSLAWSNVTGSTHVRTRPLLGGSPMRGSQRRRCRRRRAGALSAGLVVPPRSWWRGARPPLFRGGGSLSLDARRLVVRAAALAVSATALPWRRLALSVRCVVLGGRKSHRSVTWSGVGQSGAGFEGFNLSPEPEPPPDAAANAADAQRRRG